MTEISVLDAIKRAKHHRAVGDDGGPMIPSDKILIMELGWALELLLHPEINLSFDYDTDVWQKLLDDLQSGELTAFTLSSDSLIPKRCWLSEHDMTAFDSSFWHPTLYEESCKGHAGETAVVPITCAQHWLRTSALQMEHRKTKPKHKLRGREAERAFKEFIHAPGNEHLTAREIERFGTDNLIGGRETARELLRKHPRTGGSKPGPKPRT